MELKIRAVSEADAGELVEIYRYYVEHTAITYECHVPSVEEFRQRIRHTLENILIWQQSWTERSWAMFMPLR